MLHKIVRWALAALLLVTVTVGFAQTTTPYTATWSWSAPTQYTDGTAIPAGTVITYKLYTKTASTATMTQAWTGTATTATTSGYTGGQTVTGAVQACIGTNCSAFSTEASKSFPLPAPDAASNLTVK